MENRPYIYIILGAACWGTIGYFAKILLSYNMASLEIAFFRAFIGFAFIVLYFTIKNRGMLKIDKRGLIYTFVIGILCQTAFNSFYFYAVDNVGVAVSAVLLYTAPIFTFIGAVVFLKEEITKRKVFSLILCCIGCFYTATGGDINSVQNNLIGLIAGIGAGFCYGMLPVLSRPIVDKYNQWTILIYVFGFASLSLFFMAGPRNLFNLGLDIKGWFVIVLFGLTVSVIAYGLFYKGLSLGVEPSKASVMATIELVVAVVISYIAFKESLGITKVLGIVLVLSSVLLIQQEKRGQCMKTVD